MWNPAGTRHLEGNTGTRRFGVPTVSLSQSKAGADPGFLKGGSIIGLQAKKGGGQEEVQL